MVAKRVLKTGYPRLPGLKKYFSQKPDVCGMWFLRYFPRYLPSASITAAVYDNDGTYLGKYRKNHIPHTSGFWEKYFFKPGNLG